MYIYIYIYIIKIKKNVGPIQYLKKTLELVYWKSDEK